MKKRFTILMISVFIPIFIACNSLPKTDNYFSFPVQEMPLPELEKNLVMDLMPECFSGFSSFWIEDSLFLGSLGMAAEDIVMTADIYSGVETGRFGKRGRGPAEYLSPVAYDLHDGHFLVFDIMTAKVSDIDVKKSIKNGTTITSQIYNLETGEYAYLPLASIHRKNDTLLAFNTGNDPMSQDLYNVPDYVSFDLSSGEMKEDYGLFKSISLVNKKKEREFVDVKSRLALTDCVLPDNNKICFVMKFIPQINIFNPETGECHGFRVSELSANSIKPEYLHYNSVCSYGTKVFALYVGAQMNQANQAQITTELHQFSIEGKLLRRFLLDGTFVDCRAGKSGLYLSKAVYGGKDVALYRVNWETLGTI